MKVQRRFRTSRRGAETPVRFGETRGGDDGRRVEELYLSGQQRHDPGRPGGR